jgi:hypothetical protein
MSVEQWINTVGGTGVWSPNTTVHTYISSSVGTFQQGSSPGTKYFVVKGANIFCHTYVGWALPASQVKTECDNDPKCQGFIMQTDNAYGSLCAFKPQSFDSHFKLQ